MMKNKAQIDWTKVDFIEYDSDSYIKAIPIIKIVKELTKVIYEDEHSFVGYFENEKGKHNVLCLTNSYICSVDEVSKNAEELIMMIIGEDEDPSLIIQKLTGISLDDYIKSVTYSNGKEEHFKNN